jgi:AcrR family transcriptional regulator
VSDVKRSYHAPVRAEQAAQTRRRVLQAAVDAFTERGWAGTTIADIAHAAGITAQAVHLSVGAKPALLIGAVQYAVAGDQPDVPLIEREPFRHAYAADADLAQRAVAFAAGTSEVYQRAGRLLLVLAQTAPIDAELAALWASARSARLADCRHLVDLTSRRARPQQQRITDLLFVQSGPGVYSDLVGDRGWTHAAYRTWLTTTVHTLLAPLSTERTPPPQPARRRHRPRSRKGSADPESESAHAVQASRRCQEVFAGRLVARVGAHAVVTDDFACLGDGGPGLGRRFPGV